MRMGEAYDFSKFLVVEDREEVRGTTAALLDEEEKELARVTYMQLALTKAASLSHCAPREIRTSEI